MAPPAILGDSKLSSDYCVLFRATPTFRRRMSRFDAPGIEFLVQGRTALRLESPVLEILTLVAILVRCSVR
jgi:hypothetical protein